MDIEGRGTCPSWRLPRSRVQPGQVSHHRAHAERQTTIPTCTYNQFRIPFDLTCLCKVGKKKNWNTQRTNLPTPHRKCHARLQPWTFLLRSTHDFITLKQMLGNKQTTRYGNCLGPSRPLVQMRHQMQAISFVQTQTFSLWSDCWKVSCLSA